MPGMTGNHRQRHRHTSHETQGSPVPGKAHRHHLSFSVFQNFSFYPNVLAILQPIARPLSAIRLLPRSLPDGHRAGVSSQAWSRKSARPSPTWRRSKAGAIANPDEGRMVGHYWLRNADLAPTPELRQAITEPARRRSRTSRRKSTPEPVTPPGGGTFQQVLLIGIGGSALGPQLVAEAIGQNARLPIYLLRQHRPRRHGRGDRQALRHRPRQDPRARHLQIRRHRRKPATACSKPRPPTKPPASISASHAVAVTGTGSKLDQFADAARLHRPLPDGRLGRRPHLGALHRRPRARRACRASTSTHCSPEPPRWMRKPASTDAANNAAMQLALAWHHATNGKGEKDMVVLPYKDSLVLFSKYLQQLVMESLGKELDLDGKVVNQGIAVYGNKGSTDQHAYVQQLRDGVNNFFATFIEVRKGRDGDSIEVEPGTTTADYLQGFLRGTRKALYEAGRKSITISHPGSHAVPARPAHRPLRARGFVLRLARQHQRLPPAGRRSRQEGRRSLPRNPQQGPRPPHRRRQDRRANRHRDRRRSRGRLSLPHPSIRQRRGPDLAWRDSC